MNQEHASMDLPPYPQPLKGEKQGLVKFPQFPKGQQPGMLHG